MGNVIGGTSTYNLFGPMRGWYQTVIDDPDINPGPCAKPTFDPMLGFPDGRKERGMYCSNLYCVYFSFVVDILC